MRKWVMLAASAAIGGCGAPSGSGQPTAVMEQAVATADAPTAPNARAKGNGDAAAPLAVTLPQLAYAYKLGYLLPGEKIARAQEAHRALCDKMGPAKCQLLALNLGQAQDAESGASLKLRVASADARGFQDAATRAVGESGGRIVDTNVSAEDVSKEIVDAEARIRQRELLVARLTEILRTRTGKVAELVEAERSVAEAQEELDKTKGWLTELRGRVAMSDFEIRYSAVAASASPGNAGAQLGEAISGSGATFLIGLKGLLTLLIYLLPWAVLALPVVLAVRALGRKRRRTEAVRAGVAVPETDEA